MALSVPPDHFRPGDNFLFWSLVFSLFSYLYGGVLLMHCQLLYGARQVPLY